MLRVSVDYMVLVTGTPGVGKTAVSRVLSETLGCSTLNSSSYLISKGAVFRDPARDTFIVNLDAAAKAIRSLVSEVRGCLVVDTVTPTLWLREVETHVAVILLLRCNPIELLERLRGRGWSRGKILENVAAEAFNVIAEELMEWDHSVIEVDTTGLSEHEALDRFLSMLYSWRTGIRIDWMSLDEVSRMITRITSDRDFDEYRLGVAG